MSWTEALQNQTERERILFSNSEQLWPQNEHVSRVSAGSDTNLDEESAEEEVDLDAEPARTSFKRSKPLKTFGGDRAQTLVPGTYTYHLRWKTPLGVPLSFEDNQSAAWVASEGAVVPKMVSKGKSFIRYSGTASLTICKTIQVEAKPEPDLPSNIYLKEVSRSIEARDYFKLLEDVPLAALANQPPLQATQEKTFLFGGDNPLRLSVMLENGGLVFAGRSLTAIISVDNRSTRQIETVRVGVDCITTFRVGAPKTAPVLAGLAGSQVQAVHPDVTSKAGEGDWIDNVSRRENILNTGLTELSNIEGGQQKASKIAVTLPSYWPGSIVTSVHIERRYEFYAECVVSMGTNLVTRCPVRLLEWCDFFDTVLPDLAQSQMEKDLNEFDIADDEIVEDITNGKLTLSGLAPVRPSPQSQKSAAPTPTSPHPSSAAHNGATPSSSAANVSPSATAPSAASPSSSSPKSSSPQASEPQAETQSAAVLPDGEVSTMDEDGAF